MFGPREILADVVPLTFAANRFGPVVIYPDIPEVVDLMSHVASRFRSIRRSRSRSLGARRA